MSSSSVYCASQRIQIYFLARPFDKKTQFNISSDDPFATAKMGKVPESSSGPDNMPPRWCTIKTVFRKAAAAHIPASFPLAGAYDVDGDDYDWEAASITDDLLASSPLSDPPNSDTMDVDPVPESSVNEQNEIIGPETLKRK
ncbi:hypothetical protein B0H13DRAFT_1864485 [Mycena leptocephala]|nr:hypothetical protein B0H13DRAFT_1864485 [Mycena leptocephala]